MNTALLPHETDRPFVTDGGLETTLVFHEKIDLPCFASFQLLKTAAGEERLRNYYRTYAGIAREHGVGFIYESVGWRANPDWARKLGCTDTALTIANRRGIALLHEIREEFAGSETDSVVSGCIGPRGDGYRASALMTAREAAAYHAPQIRTYRDAGADIVSAMTLNYVEEAIGIANAAAEVGLPSVISFTTETDGRLPGGQSLGEAIEAVDAAAVEAPAYFMINCAHPTHFRDVLPEAAPWLQRIRGLRANASCRSHAELDECTELDAGDPDDLASQYQQLRRKLTKLHIYGGCCGTDHRHVAAICDTCLATAHALA